MTFQQVQKYESGANRVGSARLVEIARVLEVPILKFFGEKAKGENGVTKTVTDLLSESYAVEMLQAFAKIKNVDVRRKIVKLAAAIALKVRRLIGLPARRRQFFGPSIALNSELCADAVADDEIGITAAGRRPSQKRIRVAVAMKAPGLKARGVVTDRSALCRCRAAGIHSGSQRRRGRRPFGR